MRVAILGPVQLTADDGTPIPINGQRIRSLVARLALAGGAPVGPAALIDAVWDEHPPSDATNALQTLVSRVRRACANPDSILASAAGYQLGVEPCEVDAHVFGRLVAEAARTSDPHTAVDVLEEALALWRGPALTDAGPAVASEAARLDARYRAARLDALEARLELGQGEALLERAQDLAVAAPNDERAVAALMRVLVAAGRPADALRAYESLRSTLADELGTDPGQSLRELHLRILRADTTPAQRPNGDEQVRTNLREPITSFVGREKDVAAIADALSSHRLITLIGTGGSGKTRLAEQAARLLVEQYPDGVWLIALASVTDPAELPQAVLTALGQQEIRILDRRGPTDGDAVHRLEFVLRSRHILLVLDNCEHLVDPAALLAEALLARCPQLSILTTSREPLGVTGEWLLRVAPLPHPEQAAAPGAIEHYPAVRLFVDRAAAARPDFVLDDTNAALVSDIVRRLDGLPLAIELAAARLRTLPIGQIAGRLSDRFRLLTGGSRTALPRHRTLRAVVEWSWDLLTPDERELAERVAVFPGGLTLAAAQAVCAPLGLSAADVSDLLAGLVDKSLLQLVGDGQRMRMLETLREYGVERLAERSQLAAVRALHADYFAALLARATPRLYTREQMQWLDLLDAERDNAVAALHLRCDTGDSEGALSIALNLAQPALLRGNEADIWTWVAEALAVPAAANTDRRLIAEAFGVISGFDKTGHPPVSVAQMRELAEQMAGIDLDAEPIASMLRVGLAYLGGDLELAGRYIDVALGCSDAWVSASALSFRENLHENQGDVEAMRADLTAAHERFLEIGERWGLSNTLRGLAYLATLDEALAQALDYYRQALALMREMRSSDDEVFLRVRMADVHLRLGDDNAALAELQAARLMANRRGGPVESAMTNALLGHAARQAGDVDEARVRFDTVMSAIAAMGSVHPMRGHALALSMGLGAMLAMDDGNLAVARDHLVRGVDGALGTKDRPIQASVMVTVAEYWLAAGHPMAAARWLGMTTVLRGAEDRTARDIVLVRERAAQLLGEDGYVSAYREGRSATPEQVTAALQAFVAGP